MQLIYWAVLSSGVLKILSLGPNIIFGNSVILYGLNFNSPIDMRPIIFASIQTTNAVINIAHSETKSLFGIMVTY